MKKFILILCFLVLPLIAHSDPIILYTDIEMGPNTGGEDNYGTYLSIFGFGFGSEQGSSTVTINGTEVAAYKYWGLSQGRDDVYQITVQPGSSISSGAIVVTVSGADSNSDFDFTVISGDIFFVAHTGTDNASCGDIDTPCRTVSYTDGLSAYGPGDTIVLRGDGANWTDTDGTGFWDPSESGTTNAWIALIGYPGEGPIVIRKSAQHLFRMDIDYWSISNIKVAETSPVNGNKQTAVFFEGSQYARYVNNDVQGCRPTAHGVLHPGVSATHIDILGNHTHDTGVTYDSNNSHVVYVDTGTTSSLEIAYNHFENHSGGRGIQLRDVSAPCTIHHNLIEDIDVDGLVRIPGSSGDFYIYNNIFHNCNRDNSGRGVVRITGGSGTTYFYNNTFYIGYVIGFAFSSYSAVFTNNIVYLNGSVTYWSGSNTTGTDNFWYGSSAGTPSFDTDPKTTDPQMVDPANEDYTLAETSNAVDVGSDVSGTVTDDFISNSRPQNLIFDVGAYEYGTSSSPEVKTITIIETRGVWIQ